MSSSEGESQFKLFHYHPSLVAAAVAAVVFFLVSLLHLYQLVRTKTWIFVPFVIGGFFEAIGYVARIISSTETPDWMLGPYIVQSVLPLVAPALFAASIYMILGRIINLTEGEKHSIIPRRQLTKLFVLGDVLSFQVQGGGASLQSTDNGKHYDTGNYVIIGGLGIQIVVFVFFVFVAAVFHRRMLRNPTERTRSDPLLPWQKHMGVLYGTSAIILVRSVFRLIEFAQGNDGYLLRTEVWLYVFDTLLMLLVMVWFAVVHPSEIYALLKGDKGKAIRWGYKVYEVSLSNGRRRSGGFELVEDR